MRQTTQQKSFISGGVVARECIDRVGGNKRLPSCTSDGVSLFPDGSVKESIGAGWGEVGSDGVVRNGIVRVRGNERIASRISDRVSLSPDGSVKQSTGAGLFPGNSGFPEPGKIVSDFSTSVLLVKFNVEETRGFRVEAVRLPG
jgi:hypothetical protein